MSETGFTLFFRLFNLAAGILYGACLSWFFGVFPEGQRRKTGIIVFSVYLFFWLFGGRFSTLAVLVILPAVSGILEMERRRVFLLTVFFYNVRVASGLAAESLYFSVQKLFPFTEEQAEAVYLHTAGSVAFLLLGHVLVLAVLLYFLKRQMQKLLPAVRGRELCYLLLIPSAGILFGHMTAVLLFEVQDGIYLELYERHPAFLALVPLLAALFYLGTYLTVAFWQGMARLRQEREVCFAGFQKAQALRERMEETERFYEEFRRMRHEIRGHLTNLCGLARRGNYGEIEEYIARIDESMGVLDFTIRTGNPVLDVVVNDRRRQAESLGADFRSEFQYPDSGGYDAFDMGIILGNLLQNALEACEKVEKGKRYISLMGRKRGSFFLAEVRNSAAGTVIFGADGLPATTKEGEASMHGIGLANVRREVEKYMGEMELKMENGEFSAAVLLQERRIKT